MAVPAGKPMTARLANAMTALRTRCLMELSLRRVIGYMSDSEPEGAWLGGTRLVSSTRGSVGRRNGQVQRGWLVLGVSHYGRKYEGCRRRYRRAGTLRHGGNVGPFRRWACRLVRFARVLDDDDVTLLGAFYDPSAPPLAVSPPGSVNGVAAVPEVPASA